MSVNWQEIITTLGATVGGGGVVLAASAWLMKAVLTDRFARDAEVFKSRLRAEADIEIEQLKSSLQMVAVEHQVRFSKLHERRAEVIADLYKFLVVDVFWEGKRFLSAGAFSNVLQERQAKFSEIIQKFSDFSLFVDTHRIYLPDKICLLLDKFVADIRTAVVDAGVWGTVPFPSEETHRKRLDAIMRAFRAFETDIPAARRALETEFRAVLGET